MADAHSDHLPEGLDLDHVIDNSHAGDAHTRAAAPRAEDLIFVAGINNGIDAADMLTSIRDHPGDLADDWDPDLFTVKLRQDASKVKSSICSHEVRRPVELGVAIHELCSVQRSSTWSLMRTCTRIPRSTSSKCRRLLRRCALLHS